MTNKYEGLDAFLEKAFEGSPNSPEACETKIEITTNLRQEYDDLLASGMDEDEALARTCDSLGDISELFGRKETKSESDHQNNHNNQNSQYDQGKENKKRSARPKPPVSPFWQLVITLGVLLCALCWVPTVLFSINGYEGGFIASPVLISVALGVMLFIFSGSMRVGVSIATRLHYFLIGLGVACEIACAAPLLILSGDTTFGLTMLFILIALGIVLIIGGAMIPCDKYDDDDDDDDDDDRVKDDTPPIYKPIKSLIVALMLISYFVVSFATGAWAITWLIFLIGGAVDDLALAIIKLAAENKKEKENEN